MSASTPPRTTTAATGRPPHRPRTTDVAAENLADQDVIDLTREMRRLWHAGERTPAEALLARRPELAQCPEAAVDVVYEEYCLREAAGETGVEQDLLLRFPQWAGPLRVMLDCHRRVLAPDQDEPAFPSAGERLGDFQLLAEIGRGARGRVFLATQPSLADRPVVLKVVPLDGAGGGCEHLSLARLQHTNIVPLYAAIDDPGRRLRVLCMPYFGRATLASLLGSLARVPPAERAGRHVVDAIDRADGSSNPASEAPGGAARQMLERVSYVQAMCWITACLADALHFAHERGLVHLDLKPANVLLASDGQPMLLDFHLARGPVLARAGAPAPENFGGTPPYMPPEQRAAMRALRDGRPVEADVDRRADVYALGAMLYEALGGVLSAESAAPLPPLARVNPRVSTGLSDVAAKCLAADPADRYPDALTLADDVRRHLTDQPLAGVANRSLAERWRKWRRRRPGALRVAALLGATAALLAGAAWHVHDRRQHAELAMRDGRRQLQAGGDSAEAVLTFRRGLDLLGPVPFGGDLRAGLREQLAAAQRAQLAGQLRDAADAVRMLPGVDADTVPEARLRLLVGQCDTFWQRRDDIVRALGPAVSADVRADLRDIAIAAAELRVRLAPAADAAPARRDAVRLLAEAERMFGPSAAIAEYEKAWAGGADPRHAARGVIAVPRTASEHGALGRAYLASGDLARASEELSAALRADPADRWANFYAGVCAYRIGRYGEAVTAFSTCIGAAPDSAGCYHNRAAAFAALGRPDDALRDYDRALALDPAHAAAALNRAVLHLGANRLDAARADLRLALGNGADPAAVHYNLALVHLAANDRAAASRAAALALERDPSHARARELAATLGRR